MVQAIGNRCEGLEHELGRIFEIFQKLGLAIEPSTILQAYLVQPVAVI